MKRARPTGEPDNAGAVTPENADTQKPTKRHKPNPDDSSDDDSSQGAGEVEVHEAGVAPYNERKRAVNSKTKRKYLKLLLEGYEVPASLSETYEAMSMLPDGFPENRKLGFVVYKNFFTAEEVKLLRNLRGSEGTFDPSDRHRKLAYGHSVWRVEDALYHRFRPLFDKLFGVMMWTDKQRYGKIEAAGYRFFYPEIEHIVYDASKASEAKQHIEPHIDNDAVVTLVGMLTPRTQFQGGVNYFEPSLKGQPDRCYELQMGDIVCFRGEHLEHWVTPVTVGIREVIQIELSKR